MRSSFEDPAEILEDRSLHNLVGPYNEEILWRSWWSPLLCRSLWWRSRWNPSERSLHDLVQVHMGSCWNHLRGPFMILPRPFWEDLVEILMKSSKRSLHDLVQVLMRSSSEDPAEILAWSRTGPYEKILWRSWWNPLLCAGPGEKILWESWWNPRSEVPAWSCMSGSCTSCTINNTISESSPPPV